MVDIFAKSQLFKSGGVNEDDLNLDSISIDSSGNVGIGTDSPSGLLEVSENGSTDIVFGQASGGDSTNLYIGKGYNSKSKVAFYRNNTSTIDASIAVDSSENLEINYGTTVSKNFVINNNTGEVARFDNSGNLDMTATGSGNIKIKNGNGIDFSASQGSGASSSVLDDYEEGTWTPVIYIGGSAATNSIQKGSYTKIGNQVIVHFDVRISSKASLTGNVTFRGLPFTVEDWNPNTAVESGYGVAGYSSGFSGTHYGVVTTGCSGGTSQMNVYTRTSNTSGQTTLTDSLISNTFQVRVGLVYQTSA